jgi:hypothetical protein
VDQITADKPCLRDEPTAAQRRSGRIALVVGIAVALRMILDCVF